MSLKPTERIYVGLDTPDTGKAVGIARKLVGRVGGVKLGKEYFTANGPEGVRAVTEVGMPLFLDLKFHDIPNTVAGAVRAALPLKPAILNVHASGGAAMMRAARDAADTAPAAARPMLIGVTILTSLDDADLAEIGFAHGSEDQVVRLAKLAHASGLDGVVCSPKEIRALRAACGSDFKLIVPGIRPAWSETGDQKRIMTPSDAVRAGADYIVIGRPIAGAPDPAEAADRIAEELAGL